MNLLVKTVVRRVAFAVGSLLVLGLFSSCYILRNFTVKTSCRKETSVMIYGEKSTLPFWHKDYPDKSEATDYVYHFPMDSAKCFRSSIMQGVHVKWREEVVREFAISIDSIVLNTSSGARVLKGDEMITYLLKHRRGLFNGNLIVKAR